METILFGDMNVNYLVKSSHKVIKDLFVNHELDQLVKTPTRITKELKTLIGAIMANNRSNVNSMTVVPLSLSDHDCIMCVRKINYRKTPHRTITLMQRLLKIQQ